MAGDATPPRTCVAPVSYRHLQRHLIVMSRVMLRANDLCWCGSGKKYKRCHRADLLGPAWSDRGGRCRPRSCAPTTSRPANPVRKSESMVKSADVIARMRVAGAIARDVLVETGAAVAPGVTTDEIDRISHEAHIAAQRVPEPARLPGLPEVGVHVGQRGDLPRHPRRPRPRRGRHRQHRRHRLRRRRARRHQRDVRRRPHRPGVQAPGARDERVPRPRDRSGAPRCAAPRHRARDRDARPRRGFQRRAGVRRSRHRRGVPRSAAGTRTTTSRRPARSWSPGWSSPSSR